MRLYTLDNLVLNIKKPRRQLWQRGFFINRVNNYRLIKHPAARLSATPAGLPASTLSSTCCK